jgi:hypothetical protein
MVRKKHKRTDPRALYTINRLRMGKGRPGNAGREGVHRLPPGPGPGPGPCRPVCCQGVQSASHPVPIDKCTNTMNVSMSIMLPSIAHAAAPCLCKFGNNRKKKHHTTLREDKLPIHDDGRIMINVLLAGDWRLGSPPSRCDVAGSRPYRSNGPTSLVRMVLG